MEEELISKKELLDLTGISYGQLYRWKRKNLIPEDWFVRRSTFTGQETFFPKDKILPRIQRIQNMKDGLSLDQIAGQFSPTPDMALTQADIEQMNLAPEFVLEQFRSHSRVKDTFRFDDALYLFVLNELLQSGDVNLTEAGQVVATLEAHYPPLRGKGADLLLLRKMGVTLCLLISNPADVFVEHTAKVVARVDVARCVEELRSRMVGWEEA